MASEASKARSVEYTKAWKQANKDHVRAYQKQWREANKESIKAYQKDYHAEYRERDDVQKANWERNLHRNYRMKPQDFNALWESQNGKCGICGVDMLPRGRDNDAACVDHNHETNEVRGLLCRACNNGIGCLKDDPAVLEAAARYLREKGHYSSNSSELGANHE